MTNIKRKGLAGRPKLEALIYSIISIGILLLLWTLLSESGRLGRVFPSPAEIFTKMMYYFVNKIGPYILPKHILISLRRVAVGYGIAVCIGLPLGLIMGYWRLGKAIAMPLVQMVRPIPGLAWIPLAILWFGIGEEAKYFIICMTAILRIILQTYYGFRNVDPTLVGAAKMLGAKPLDIFARIAFPSAIPDIFVGLQIGFAGGWCAVVAAEMLRSDEGAGWLIIAGQRDANYSQILMGMVCIGIIGLIIAGLMRTLERRLCRWKIQGK
jgi:NitT/TauT family transport system permease protein/sulfonate transport system permease protein